MIRAETKKAWEGRANEATLRATAYDNLGNAPNLPSLKEELDAKSSAWAKVSHAIRDVLALEDTTA